MLAVYLLVTVVIAAGAALLIVRATVAAMGRFGVDAIQDRQTNADFIAREGKVPPEWRVALEKRLPGLKPDCGDQRKAAAHKRRAKVVCLRRLRRLIRHFRRTSLVVDERTRETLVSALLSVYGEWRASEWKAMAW